MARPTKAVTTSARNISKEERLRREEAEAALRGNADKLTPSDYLNDEQAAIFEYIRDELLKAGIIGNLDIFILEHTAIAIDRLTQIDKAINEDPALMGDSAYISARDKIAKEFFRCCNELSLSPQARAKIANNAQPPAGAGESRKDKLLQILASDSYPPDDPRNPRNVYK